MKNLLRSLSLLAVLVCGFTPMGRAQQFIVCITNNDQIVVITAANPAMPISGPVPIPVTGLASGQTIAGADYRPRTGELFILGYNSANGEARLYTVTQTTGVASPVGAANITISLGSGAVGFDFNPTVDLIRVVAANRMNYRLSPVTGAIVATDGMLTYATGDANAAATPNIGAAAYTNSYVASEATTLYDYDESLNILATQVPPNNGTLNTVGSSGIVSIGTVGSRDMDIAFDSATSTNRAYLTVPTTSAGITTTSLYTINLSTGAATLVGPIGTNLNIKDIAVAIVRNIPANITGQLVYGLTRTNRNLITFDTDRPGTIRKFTPVTGVTSGQRIVGMDFRPLDRRLYALGYNDTTSAYTLYTIDTANGAATAVNTTTGTMALGAATARLGFDFNPTVDRIRVTSSNGANFRLNPTSATTAATPIVDSMLAYRVGDVNAGRPARVGSVAYTNSFAGAGSTTLFAIDDSLGALLVLDTPNGGKLRTLAATFFPPNQTDPTNDFDIYYDSAAMTNTAYLAVNTGASVNDSLWMFTPNATTAPTLTAVGRIGFGTPIMDIAVQPRFSGTTSIRELSAVPGVDVYPNPAGETLFVRTAGTGTVRAVIMDLSGRTVLSTDGELGSVLTLGVGRLPAGIYNLRLESGGKILGAAKVVKQ